MLSLQALQLQSLLLGLERRLPQLEKDISMLEKEDDGDLYGVISLQLAENELLEIQQLLDKLNSTTLGQQRLSDDTVKQVNICNRGSSNIILYSNTKMLTRCMIGGAIFVFIHH